jgi:hypothetical protein
MATPTAGRPGPERIFNLFNAFQNTAGEAYTFTEYEKMFRGAGFAKSVLHPIPEMPQQVIVSEKAG